MEQNANELISIRRKTSYNPQLKKAIADEINKIKSQVEVIKHLPKEEQKIAFIKLKAPYTLARQNAYKNGSSSEGSPEWAVPAVIESWLFCYLSNNEENVIQSEQVIEQLSDYNRPEESSILISIGNVVKYFGTVLAFYFGTWWLAIIVFIIGAIMSGWAMRYNGPLITK
jgi:hypothetical protein